MFSFQHFIKTNSYLIKLVTKNSVFYFKQVPRKSSLQQMRINIFKPIITRVLIHHF